MWHIFPILTPQRDKLQQFLLQQGIQTVIHYPIPPHQQGAYKEWNHRTYPMTERIHEQELSIPLNQTLNDAEVNTIVNVLNSYPT